MSRTIPDLPHREITDILDHWFTRLNQKLRPQDLDRMMHECVRKLDMVHPGDSFEKKSKRHRLAIALFTKWKYPHMGGLSRYIETLEDALRQRGHKVDVFSETGFGSRWASVKHWKSDLADQYKRRYGNEAQAFGRTDGSLLAYEELVAKHDLGRYDILHAQDLFAANVLIRLRHQHGRPIVYTPHGIMTDRRTEFDGVEPCSLTGLYYRMLDHIAATGSDRVVVLYKAMGNRLHHYGLTAARMCVVPTGIDFDHFISPLQRTDDKRPTVSYIGRLTQTKGAQYLLEALKHVPQHAQDMEAQIVGEGPILSSLRKQGKSLERVRFLGKRDQIQDVLRSSDILVVPGVSESFPVVIIEGMFAGQAIIASQCGGIPDMIRPGDTGLLFPPGDVRALAKHLTFLSSDRAARVRLGVQAQQYAREHFTVDRMVRDIESVYWSLLKKDGVKRR